MALNTTVEPAYEKTIIRVLKTLPVEQAQLLTNFALLLESQFVLKKTYGEDLPDFAQSELDLLEDEATIAVSEAKWDELFTQAGSSELMRKMALAALADDEVKLTSEMRFDKVGNLVVVE